MARHPNFTYTPCILNGEPGKFYVVGNIETVVLGALPASKAATLAKPDVRERIIKAGQPIVRSSTPEEFAAYVAQANKNWREVVARANIKIE